MAVASIIGWAGGCAPTFWIGGECPSFFWLWRMGSYQMRTAWCSIDLALFMKCYCVYFKTILSKLVVKNVRWNGQNCLDKHEMSSGLGRFASMDPYFFIRLKYSFNFWLCFTNYIETITSQSFALNLSSIDLCIYSFYSGIVCGEEHAWANVHDTEHIKWLQMLHTFAWAVNWVVVGPFFSWTIASFCQRSSVGTLSAFPFACRILLV